MVVRQNCRKSIAKGSADMRHLPFQELIVSLEARRERRQFDDLWAGRDQLLAQLLGVPFTRELELPFQQRLDFVHRLVGRQFEHMQVFNDSGSLAVVGHEPIRGGAKEGAGLKRLPMTVMPKGSGLAQQAADDMPKIHQRAAIPAQPGQAKQELPPQIHFQLGLVLLHPESVTD